MKEAATAYAELLRTRAKAGDDVLRLVPTGLAAGALDDGFARRCSPSSRPRRCSVPPRTTTLLRPRDAVVVDGADGALVGMLAHVIGGLVGATRMDKPALDALGVRRLPARRGRRPARRHRRVAAAGLVAGDLRAPSADSVNDPLTRESLGALPVPLADGRVVRGARGLLLPGADLPAEALSAFGSVRPPRRPPRRRARDARTSGRGRREPARLARERRTACSRGGLARCGRSRGGRARRARALSRQPCARTTCSPATCGGWATSPCATKQATWTPANALVVPGSEAEAHARPGRGRHRLTADLVERFGAATVEAAGVARTLRSGDRGRRRRSTSCPTTSRTSPTSRTGSPPSPDRARWPAR